MTSSISFRKHFDLHSTVSPNDSSNGLKAKIEVGGVVILGDSLSDPGRKDGMYNMKILGCIPLSLFLHKSPHKQFTNGFVWSYGFFAKLESSKNSHKTLYNRNLVPIDRDWFKFDNRAQGGAMAYNYRGFLDFFRCIKGFFLSLVLTNIQSEAKKIKKEENSKLNPEDLCIIFAGANDLVTAGYCDKGGAERAIQGVAKTIEILTSPEKKENSNYAKNILVFTLPDFSKTPRFSKKTEKEKQQAQEACVSFNEGLRTLAKSYQYLDFTLCDIYQEKKKENVNLNNIKKKGIIITGSKSTRKVYFVDNKQFILKDGNEITIDINLTETEIILLDNLKNDSGLKNVIKKENLVHRLCDKAKLNADVKIFDAAAVFDKIDENPEVYGFTSGCAVYYLDKNQDKECISKNVTSGNAIIIKEINQDYNSQNGLPAELEFCCYYVKDGKLVEHEINTTKIASITSFTLTIEEKAELQKKLKQHPLVNGISQLIGLEDKHAFWTTNIVQSAIKAYKDKFGRKIQLTDIYASVLLAIKKNLPNQQDIFWDDLHPSVIVHFLLETMFESFFESNYSIKQPRVWRDDMAINVRVSDEVKLPRKAAEA
jgi:phospholipase/lecithinase/hemolysin